LDRAHSLDIESKRGLGVRGQILAFITKIIHFKHTSAKILPKNLRSPFDIVSFGTLNVTFKH